MGELAYNNMPTNMTASEVRQPEVLIELGRLTDGCIALQKLAEALEDRLKGVLATRAETAGNPASPEPVRVPLAAAFHDRVINLDSIAAQLSSILNRLEI